MKREGSTGLMGFWADIDPDYVLRFQEWHNCEHIAERIGVPGFNTGRRYRGMDGAPMFFMCYETDDPGVLASAPYHERLNNPTPWTSESLQHFRKPSRNIYGLLAEAGGPLPVEAPYSFQYRFNLAEGEEEDTADWLGSHWLNALCALDSVHRGQLYRVDEEISAIMTSERKIYGGGAGQQKYLALFEVTEPRTGDTAAWQAAEGSLPGAERYLPNRQDLFSESFWLEIALYAP